MEIMNVYCFEDLEIEHNDALYYVTGEVQYDYEPGEPDEKWGHWGATPGYASSASGISVIQFDSVVTTLEDDDEVEMCSGGFSFVNKKPRSGLFIHDLEFEKQRAIIAHKVLLIEIAECVETYFYDNQEILTEDYEN